MRFLNAKKLLLNAKLNLLYVFSTTFTPQSPLKATLVYVKVASTSSWICPMSYYLRPYHGSEEKMLMPNQLVVT